MLNYYYRTVTTMYLYQGCQVLWVTALNNMPQKKTATQNTGNTKLTLVHVHLMALHPIFQCVLCTCGIDCVSHCIFYGMIYKIVMQHSLMVYCETSHLSFVISWYTTSPKGLRFVYTEKIQLIHRIFHGIPLESVV